MDPATIIIVVAAVGAVIWFKRAGLIGAQTARDLIQQGAKIVDVRSPAEFGKGHLKQAANIPLDDVKDTFKKRFPDKEKPYLLHCLSGTRSMMAKRILKQHGYANAHNLGSYGRAARIVGD